MARFGSLPVKIAKDVTVKIEEGQIKVLGPKGELKKKLPLDVTVKQIDDQIFVETKGGSKQALSDQGTTKSHITNMVKGVSVGFVKSLELVGTGFKAELKGEDLILTVGYSHPVEVKKIEGVKFSIEKNFVHLEGIDLEKVTSLAAKIKKIRKPDPYQGKGIKYKDEILRKKPGKQAAKGV
ncbi:50S ribosomal protein L6 [Candidatus Woesebacteria bacterium]|nr:50S ribosomal protein L6 [Candidatus Woesebacteria bacterium]QQG47796.1 MAG: 50S ribosomal protein L6 [Candidatus Woesebacteria bacterium]